MRFVVVLPLMFCVSCGSAGTNLLGETTPDEGVRSDAGADELDAQAAELRGGDADLAEGTVAFDAELAPDEVPACAPGEGCFLSECKLNEECGSGWCVEHMGEGVCTVLCQEECPPGWECRQVAGAAPDAVFICVSTVTNLCRPCNAAAECKTAYGAEDVCVRYGDQGSFCGAACDVGGECPWGFSCKDVETVDGVATKQCVSDTGLCPCTEKSTSLSLWTECAVVGEAGTCKGKRVCTAAGLTECDATLPQAETCNGSDDDCDGDTDEPSLVDGEFVSLCDDGNPCTEDGCSGNGGCESVALDGGECMDGDPCTAADHCDAGICMGDAVDCNDGNVCTQDLCTATGGCEHPPADGECDDSDPCTLGDHCVVGECHGEAVACSCYVDADCADLEDGNLCNGKLHCETGAVPFSCAVIPESIIECPSPSGKDAPCEEAVCDPATGSCSTVASNDGAPCVDDDACTVGDACLAGTCAGGPAANCNDGNPCTDDSCVPDSGCAHGPNIAPCNDGDSCTVGESCAGGSCQPGVPLKCDDQNPCTDDQCVPGVGCGHTANELPCDDGNACTSGDQCSGGWCVAPVLVACDDGNECTLDVCVPADGCVHVLQDVACDDGDPCTVGDKCISGLCTGGTPQSCDDGNPCTNDSCSAAGLCMHVPNVGACSDGNICTAGDHCEGSACVPQGPLDCDDDNVCTDDTCLLGVGCAHSVNTDPCDDNSLCTLGDKCATGVCVPGAAVQCGDGNVCTDDACAAATGCVYKANTAGCSDGNACTVGDVCAIGACTPGDALVCDDLDLCTTDTCDPQAGCMHSQNTVPCDDGNACTAGEKCSAGLCMGGAPVSCVDGNPCTDDGCAPATGCIFINNAEACSDGDACTVGDTCSAGGCVPGLAPDCNDQEECTQDSCVPASGCLNAPIPDDTPCTAVPDGICFSGNCVPSALSYANGNEAYWQERKLGFRDVTIGGGAVVYSYLPALKQYRNGGTILLPTKSGGANGQTMSATSFFGLQGGSAADANFQWDGGTVLQQPHPFDVPNMFVSPVLQQEMSYCKILQFDNVSCGATTIDGPAETLAYPTYTPGPGTYDLITGGELVNAGDLKGTGNQRISQQQLAAGAHPSWCVSTYGNGWRLATDVEMGHPNDGTDQVCQDGYRGDSSYRIRTSTMWPGLPDQRWCPYSNTGLFNQCNVPALGSRRTRCVFPGK